MIARFQHRWIAVLLLSGVAATSRAHQDVESSAPPPSTPDAASGEQQSPAPTATADAKPSATPEEIAAWIGQLDDNRYLAREQASRKLLEAGPAVLDPLLETANGDRPEPADRAVWVLRRLSEAKDDPSLRRQTLERLAAVKGRPRVSEAARQALAEIRHAEAVAAIEKLGARFTSPQFGGGETNTAPYMTVRVILDGQWKGGETGLKHLRDLLGLRQVIIVGTNISADGLAELRNIELLEALWLYGTKVDPKDLPKLQTLLAQVEIDYRRGGLLGIGSNSPDGMGPAVVGTVAAGSAAEAAGIKVGDMIQEFEGEPVATFRDLTKRIGDRRAGDEVRLKVLREGKPLSFAIKLGQWQTI